MKKFLILVVLSAFICGCASDSESSSKEPSGQYVFNNDTLTVSISFIDNGRYYESGKSTTIQVFLRNKIEYQNLYGTTYEGEYPSYSILAKDGNISTTVLVMNCRFLSTEVFDANVTMQRLSDVYWGNSHGHVYLPSSMTFKRDDTVLDKNGDGILDTSQGF